MKARNIARRATLGLTALTTLVIAAGSVKAQEGQGSPQDPNRPPAGLGRGENPPPPPGRRPEGFPVIPPHLAEELNLTDKQRAEFAALEKEVNEKIKKILTADQMKKLKTLRDQHRPPMGRNGMRPPPPPPGGFEGRDDRRGGRHGGPPPPPRDGGRDDRRGGRPGGPPPPPRDGGRDDRRDGRPGGPPPPPRDGGRDDQGGPPPPPRDGGRDEAHKADGAYAKA